MVNKFHSTQEEYPANKTYDSIYSYDYDWTDSYDSIYNGYYVKADDKDILRPVWSICDHHNFQLLSFYEVDLDRCPEHYDPKYKEYTLL
jgi:hypothetical protein